MCMQSSLEQAVQLEEGRLSAVALRSKCRKLESESLFADVFEKYEEEIRQLQVGHPMHPPICVLTATHCHRPAVLKENRRQHRIEAAVNVTQPECSSLSRGH